jgi:hypothetical protein
MLAVRLSARAATWRMMEVHSTVWLPLPVRKLGASGEEPQLHRGARPPSTLRAKKTNGKSELKYNGNLTS